MAKLVATFSPCHSITSSTTSIVTTSFSRLNLFDPKSSFISLFLQFSPARRFFCKSSADVATTAIDISKQREAFTKRMAMAGLNPNHRIALGVSGGPDSMSLCLLTARWKSNSSGVRDCNGYIDGLLAIIVDHGLRTESKDEAEMVYSRVSKLGIRCEIVTGDWSSGRPKQGHLQEAARDLRYRNFQEVCIRYQIGVLLIAHHADDQAELFILRLSRNSGVLGLAGMAFTSQLYPAFPLRYDHSSKDFGIILVRPLLDLTKDDLYEVCKEGDQEWVEDPTNRSQLYARNRIRMALIDKTACTFKSELQGLISMCRRIRTYVDFVSHSMINQAVKIMDYGYAVIDLNLLDPPNRDDICLSKFLAAVLQFISQRNRPIRGSASKLLLDYIRVFPCKASLTAAGCYLCPAPGTKGTRVLVCCSVESVRPSSMMELYSKDFDKQHKYFVPHEVDQIIMEGESHLEQPVLSLDMSFLNDVSSDALLNEAKRLNLLSEPTYKSIIEMKMFEADRFKSTNIVVSGSEMKKTTESVSPYSEPFPPGQICYFMHRFAVTWSSSDRSRVDYYTSHKNDHELVSRVENQQFTCSLCANGEMLANIRHMIDNDWLYLAQLSKPKQAETCQQAKAVHYSADECTSDYARVSAQQALASLKSIPVAARRGLPVLISLQGLLLSIPSIGFKHCPCLMVSAEFKPRVPLGGGHSSFM